jgi:hypothetical protein
MKDNDYFIARVQKLKHIRNHLGCSLPEAVTFYDACDGDAELAISKFKSGLHCKTEFSSKLKVLGYLINSKRLEIENHFVRDLKEIAVANLKLFDPDLSIVELTDKAEADKTLLIYHFTKESK